MQNEKILITGAAGFIGSHLVDYLLKKGVKRNQLLLVIAPWDTLENLDHHDSLQIVRLDIRETEKLSHLVEGCRYVYHLAAKIDFDGNSYEEYEAVNVLPTLALLAASVKYQVKKFVFFSSIGVHGLPAGIGNIINWNEAHPATYTNWYGKSKWYGELLVRLVHQKTGLPYAIIRPASVYGPREKGPTLALYKAINARQFAMIGDGRNKMHYVYVTDLVSAAYSACISGLNQGEYIIGGPEPEQFKNIAKHIAASIHKRLLPFSIPVFLALPMAGLMQTVFQLFGTKAPLYPERVRTMTTTYYYDISRAKKELHYKPAVSFAVGAEKTGKWYLQHGYV